MWGTNAPWSSLEPAHAGLNWGGPCEPPSGTYVPSSPRRAPRWGFYNLSCCWFRPFLSCPVPSYGASVASSAIAYSAIGQGQGAVHEAVPARRHLVPDEQAGREVDPGGVAGGLRRRVTHAAPGHHGGDRGSVMSDRTSNPPSRRLSQSPGRWTSCGAVRSRSECQSQALLGAPLAHSFGRY
jgi:hypothetical protein